MSNAIAQLDQLAANLAELSSVPSRAARPAAEAITALLQDEFDSETSPDGEHWAALMPSTVKRKGGDDRILIRTEATRNNTYARPSAGAGIQIVTSEAALFHQTGTSHHAARPILPGDKDGLPAEWQDAIDDAVDAAFRKVMGR